MRKANHRPRWHIGLLLAFLLADVLMLAAQAISLIHPRWAPPLFRAARHVLYRGAGAGRLTFNCEPYDVKQADARQSDVGNLLFDTREEMFSAMMSWQKEHGEDKNDRFILWRIESKHVD